MFSKSKLSKRYVLICYKGVYMSTVSVHHFGHHLIYIYILLHNKSLFVCVIQDNYEENVNASKHMLNVIDTVAESLSNYLTEDEPSLTVKMDSVAAVISKVNHFFTIILVKMLVWAILTRLYPSSIIVGHASSVNIFTVTSPLI